MTESNNLLEQLNPEQRSAVEASEGPVLILAGAGSGKTRVLTYRIAYLIAQHDVSPREILAMTFTNKAAGEMRERMRSFINPEGLWIGTFHSIFAKFLRFEAGHFGYRSDFVIYDADDQQRLVKSVMETMNVSTKQYNPKSIRSTISKAKNSLITPDAYLRSVNSPYEELVSKIYPEYQNRLRRNQAFDFDDLIVVPIELFERHPEILEKYQSRFRYVMVDEYQDTNHAQYRLIHQLASGHLNLCVVGDDDQSIYGWRGADIRNILDFEKDFPDARIFRLEQNYRSTKNILKAASSLVEKNTGRKGKTLWTENEGGEKVTVIETSDEHDEAQQVVTKIQSEVIRKKRAFKDFAILYRTNAQSRALEDALRRTGMSYIIVGGVRFYERKEVKDVLAYLKVLSNPDDGVSLKRIINFPTRGIGDTTLQRLEAYGATHNLSLFEVITRVDQVPELQNRAQQAVTLFHGLMQKYIDLKGNISDNELIHTMVDETGILSMYKEDGSIEAQGRAENVKELLVAIDEYLSGMDDASLSGFLEQVSLVTDVDQWNDRSNAITLMTLHCAKGLEFPVVLITGLEEGLLPVYQNQDDPEAVEEERRLFYVGLTRARRKIYLSWAQRRSRFNESSYRLTSRFLNELDPSVLEKERSRSRNMKRVPFYGAESSRSSQPKDREPFDTHPHPDYESFSQEAPSIVPGATVQHELFGRGKVLRVDGSGPSQILTVSFEGGVNKKLAAKFANLKIL